MRLLALASLFLLTACGFHPVYGVNKHTSIGVEEKLAATQINTIPDREGQFLRNALIDRFYRAGRPINPAYTLSIDPIRESKRDLDITIDADATRGQLRLTTTMRLDDQSTGETLLERQLVSITSYNILASEFTNRVSEQNTRENALRDLAEQIENQIALYFKRSP